MAGKKRRVKSQDFNKQYQKAIDVFGSTVNSESRRSDSCRDDHFTLSQKTLYFTLALMCALAPTASALIQETSIGGNQSKRRARLRETTASNTLTSQTTEAIHAIDTSSSASEVTLWELLCANLAELYSVTEKTEYEEDHQPLAFMKVQSGRNAPEETVVMVSHTIGDANGVNGKTRDVQLLATDSHACGLEGYPPGICNYTGSVRTTLGLFEDNAPNGERRKALAVVKTNATHVVVAQPTKWSHSSNEAPIGIPDIMSGYQVILPPYIGYGDIPVDKYRQGTLTGPKEIPAPGCYFIQSELLQSDASCPSELKIAVSAYTQYCNTTNQPVPYSFQQGTAVIVAYGPQNQGRTTADPIFTVSGGISLVMSLLCYAQDSDTTVLAFSYYTPDGTVKVAHIPDVERLSGNIDLRLDPQTTVINVFNSNYFNIPILTRIAPLFFDESNGKYIENVLAIQYNNFTYNPKYPGKIIYGDSEGVITALKGLGSQKVKIFDIKSPPYPITTARTVFPNMFIEQFLPDVGSQRNMTALFLNTPYYEYFYNKADYNTHLNVLSTNLLFLK